MRSGVVIFFGFLFTLVGCGPSAIHFMREGGEVIDLPKIESQIEIKKVWRRDLGDGYSNSNGLLSPIIVGGEIFAAEPSGRILALSEETGSALWETNLEKDLAAGVGVGSGVVIVATRDGEVVGLQAKDGSEYWRAQIGTEILAQPVIAGDLAILRSGDGQVVGLDVDSGKLLWRVRRSVPALSVRGVSTPIIIDDVVLVGFASGRLSGIDLLSGRERWSVPIFRPQGSNEIARLVDIDSDPYVLGDSIFIAGFQSKITALSISSQTINWESQISTIRSLGSVDQVLLVTADDGQIFGIDTRSGKTLWTESGLQNRGVSGPLGIPDLNQLVVGDYKGNLVILDVNTGEMIGRDKLPGGAVLKIYSLSESGHFLVLSENGALSAWAIQ
ncbi:MAG: outer membrane protein assembly factor BamB [Candidatus Thioglobus sp.]|nr:MAG: outer membrane protein assembly factor BamB [Candidatus Thioglobus sp.]